jgi:hypothetical protein
MKINSSSDSYVNVIRLPSTQHAVKNFANVNAFASGYGKVSQSEFLFNKVDTK